MAGCVPEGYKKKTKAELLSALESCISITQLFALVQHENINMRMHTLPGASNIPPKRLEIREISTNQTHLDRLKAAVKMAVENTVE